MNLNRRFLEFCRNYPGAEDLDSLSSDGLRLKKGDFLFEGRSIICEIKSIEIDQTERLEEVMAEHGVHPSTLQSGTHLVGDLLSHREYRRTIKSLTHAIGKSLNDAAKQIRDTKVRFGIPHANGLVILLNENIPIIGHALIHDRIGLFQKKVEKYHLPQEIVRLLYISEANVLPTQDGDKRLNMTYGLAPQTQPVESFVGQLAVAWAHHCGQPFERASSDHDAVVKRSKLFVKVD